MFLSLFFYYNYEEEFMRNQFARTELVLGKAAVEKLAQSRVAVFGIGGVGSYVAEALVRSGLGTIDIIDNDEICESNINRQLYATHKTVGKLKVEVAQNRILEINPDCVVNIYKTFYTPEIADLFDFSQYDYVIDAIDTVAGKLSLIERTKMVGTPIICAMGAGNKLDPTKFEVADISKTSVCPLAKIIRTELRKRKIKKVKVVYSKELPIKQRLVEDKECKGSTNHPAPGSVAFVPPVMGLIIAGEVIKDLTGVNA